MNASNEDLLNEWLEELRQSHKAHGLTAAKYERQNRMLGLPVVALSAIVGSSIFTTLQQSPDQNVKITIGSLSIVAAVLAGMQTFLKFSELAEKHKTTAVRYGDLKREVQQIVLGGPDQSDNYKALLQDIRTRWNALDEQAPGIPAKIREKAATK